MIYKSLFVTVALIGMTAWTGCKGLDNAETTSQKELKYPYYATAQRSGQIRYGSVKLFPGIPQEEVIKLMGEPDEKNVFSSDLGGKPEGYVWTYVIERKKPTGSFVERKEKSIRLRFGLNKKLLNTDYLGLRKPTRR